nr:ribonuclease H-like domain-containing protein [Tanacetum cinerariifolium]
MAKGCQIFLAQISAKKEEDMMEGNQLEDVLVVTDYPKVFPKDLPGRAPARPASYDLVSHLGEPRSCSSKRKMIHFSLLGVIPNFRVKLSSGNANVANAQRNNGANPKGNGCFECGATGHFKRDCPKLKNKDGKKVNAPGWVYAVGSAEKKGNVSRDLDSNVVTCSFLLNNRYASILFDTDAHRSFISTAFNFLIDIVPTLLGNSYDVELADARDVTQIMGNEDGEEEIKIHRRGQNTYVESCLDLVRDVSALNKKRWATFVITSLVKGTKKSKNYKGIKRHVVTARDVTQIMGNEDGEEELKIHRRASKSQHWVDATNKEMDALYENHIWDITGLPSGRKAINGKWVYKIKYKSNGEIEIYKARYVIKGYTSDLTNANLEGANLEGADLKTSDLTNANLEGANLEGADLKATCLYLKMLFACEVLTLNLSLSREEPEESAKFAGRKEMIDLPCYGYPSGYCRQV